MFKYRIVRNSKEKEIYVKKGFVTYAVYSGGAWEWSDEEIFEDFLHNVD